MATATPAEPSAAAAVPTLWTDAVLADALALAEAEDTVRAAAAALRTRYAPLRIVVVDALDLRGETPAAAGARWQLHFGASDGHCWTIGHDPAQVAGFFIAPRA